MGSPQSLFLVFYRPNSAREMHGGPVNTALCRCSHTLRADALVRAHRLYVGSALIGLIILIVFFGILTFIRKIANNKVRKGFWTHIENQRLFLDSLGRNLQLKEVFFPTPSIHRS